MPVIRFGVNNSTRVIMRVSALGRGGPCSSCTCSKAARSVRRQTAETLTVVGRLLVYSRCEGNTFRVTLAAVRQKASHKCWLHVCSKMRSVHQSHTTYSNIMPVWCTFVPERNDCSESLQMKYIMNRGAKPRIAHTHYTSRQMSRLCGV